jgi:hypothetical protein
VRSCSSCRERLAGLERVVAALDRLRDQAPPRHLEQLVSHGVESLRPHRSLRSRLEARARRLNALSSWVPFFGVVLALVVIIYLLSMGIAREERASTRLILGYGRSVASLPVPGDRREVAERVFLWTGEAWAERGAEGEPLSRHISREGSGVEPELEALIGRLAVLEEAVRFRYQGEVLELPAREGN